MNISEGTIDGEFQRQVYLCGGIGADRMLEIVEAYRQNPERFRNFFGKPALERGPIPCDISDRSINNLLVAEASKYSDGLNRAQRRLRDKKK